MLLTTKRESFKCFILFLKVTACTLSSPWTKDPSTFSCRSPVIFSFFYGWVKKHLHSEAMALLTSGKNVQLFGPKNFSQVNQLPKSPKDHLIITSIIIITTMMIIIIIIIMVMRCCPIYQTPEMEVTRLTLSTRTSSFVGEAVATIMSMLIMMAKHHHDHPSFAGMVAAIINITSNKYSNVMIITSEEVVVYDQNFQIWQKLFSAHQQPRVDPH